MEKSCQGRCSREKCKDCCKSFTAFLFSTLGLVISVAAYSAAGGFLFNMIEVKEEDRLVRLGRERVNFNRSHYVDALWEKTVELDIFYPENWTAEAHVLLKKFQADVYLATTQHNWDGKTDNLQVLHKWNFAGALLYAVTAITTIGYGHVTPNTDAGKWATMLYSLVGLPLTLMCIANVGKFFARIFKVIYHTCFCGVCCVCCLAYRRKKAAQKEEQNNNNNGSIKSLNTVGNGTALTITNDFSSGSKQESSISKLTQAQVWLRNVKSKFSHSMQDSATVPAWVCLVVMVTYIMGGALLFSVWEQWDYLSGAYFCFVTLTTIGFGDLVPGMATTDSEEKDITSKLILCAVYVLFGLALIGMCIDLMQADVINKVKWIARKIGIMEDVKKTRKKKQKKIGKQPENDSTIHQLVSATLPEDNTYDSDEEQMQVIVVTHDDEKLTNDQGKFNHNNSNNSNNAVANDRRYGSTVPARFRGCKAADSISDVIIDMQQNNLPVYSPGQGQEVNETCVDLTPPSECTPPAYAHLNHSAANEVSQECSPPASCYDNMNNNDATPLHARLADVDQPLLEAEHIDSIDGKTTPSQSKQSLGTSKSFHNFHQGTKQPSLPEEVPRRREHSESDAVVGNYDFLDQILRDPVFKPVQASILPESTSDFDFSPTDLPPVMSASRTSNV